MVGCSSWMLVFLLVPTCFVMGQIRREIWGKVVSGEYCDFESFNGRCDHGEILTMVSAEYGHMKKGKCIQADIGFFGCKADVLDIIERKCRGLQVCELQVDDSELRETNPCTPGIDVYLDATYACIKAVPERHICQPLQATPTQQYISNIQLNNARCRHHQSLQIQAKPGQKITFSLTDLAPQNQRQRENGVYGLILDEETSTQLSITSDGRSSEREIGGSDSNRVSVVLDDQHTRANFIIGYRATGCANFDPPEGTVVERTDDKLRIICLYTEQSWELQCRGAHWIGVIGNCTKPVPATEKTIEVQQVKSLKLPRDVIYLIIGCATVFLSVLVVTIGCVCLKGAKLRHNNNPLASDGWQFHAVNATLLPKHGPNSDYITPRYVAEGQGEQIAIYDTPLPDPPTTGTQPRGTVRRNTGEDYDASTLCSNATDYTARRYFVLDKDYMNTTNLIDP